jgi:hypothetical protein
MANGPEFVPAKDASQTPSSLRAVVVQRLNLKLKTEN